MNLIRATRASLSKLLSVGEDQVDDALQSARLVKRHLSRRGMFQAIGAAAAAAALPSGMAFSELAPAPSPAGLILSIRDRVYQPFWDTLIRTAGWAEAAQRLSYRGDLFAPDPEPLSEK